jgi:hypothetical protein
VRLCAHAAAGGSKAAKATAKAAAKQDKRNAKLKEQRAAEAAAPKKRSNELQVRKEGGLIAAVLPAAHHASRYSWGASANVTAYRTLGSKAGCLTLNLSHSLSLSLLLLLPSSQTPHRLRLSSSTRR